ncbi:EVE domain-containing protein [Candidatus Nomurabacteria bacterium]|nr:EVE domain-containing protein [Candidatus Kaiserbacteria bacterium]MCB9810191.1 EVE domain-containing protein [Candidatus Nomurabacteria bacterium]MCB9818234.1 EVE domain-containing protein [Candidatus Nomurabacteria bacterium]
MKYWLMKTEPNEFSIDDLQRVGVEMWDGVRNYQVRNMMRNEMMVGDSVLVYHSNAGEETGIAGTAKICRKAYPDPTQFDPESAHPDPKSDPQNPRWLCVDVEFIQKFKRILTLKEIKSDPNLLDYKLVQKGNRLSVIPTTKKQFDYILRLAKTL